MRPVDVFYAVATGPEPRRRLLTAVGLVVFTAWLLLPLFLSRFTDRVFSLPRLPGALAWFPAVPLLVVGGLLWGWCILLFWKARGTPVPFNPPRDLVAEGPYAWMRNPMLVGVCACLFALGFFLRSVSMVVVWTPLFVLANALLVRLIEEPELERRLGPSYTEYKRRVPMFVPRALGIRRRRESSN